MRTNESDSPKRRTTPAAKRTRTVSTAAKSPKKTQKASAVRAAVRLEDDMIRARAYEIYLERGHHGDPMEDWLRAERELIEPTAG
jgi:hypothetical protein